MKPSNHYDNVHWDFYGGTPEIGEHEEETVIREVKRRTGYDTTVIQYIDDYTYKNKVLKFYLLEKIGNQQAWKGFETKEEETWSTKWVTKEQAWNYFYLNKNELYKRLLRNALDEAFHKYKLFKYEKLIMKISKKGREELVKSEGVRTQVYDDWTGKIVSSYEEVTGFPTIGVGHLIKDNERNKYSKYFKGGKSLTPLQVDQLLKDDIKRFTKPLNDELKTPVTQQMYDALVSYSFNVGNNSSWRRKVIDKINLKDYIGAGEILGKYPNTSKGNVLQGLIKRRKKELELFISGGMPKLLTPITNTITTYPVRIMLLLGLSFYLIKNKKG